MVSTRLRGLRRLLPALIAAAALAVGLVAPRATAAAEELSWVGYAVTADFESGQPKVFYTVFGGLNGPPAQVLDFIEEEITGDCSFTDITYSGGYAVFNGSSSRIECALPSFADKLAELFPELPTPEAEVTCTCGGAPLWASAQAILDPVSGEQPAAAIVHGSRPGMLFKLQSNGARARTSIELPNGVDLTSPQWIPSPSSNRVLLGVNGPSIIALDDEFGWLSYLSPQWEAAFAPVVGQTARHWFEAPNRANWVSAPAAYKLNTGEGTLTIGHNPLSGAYFDGRLRFVRLDPGCPAF
jgi:hypothetical protein